MRQCAKAPLLPLKSLLKMIRLRLMELPLATSQQTKDLENR